MRPCSAAKVSIDALEQRADQPLRQRAISPPGPVGVEAPRQEIETDMKGLLGGEVARPVQGVLVALPLGHERLDPLAHRLVVETIVEVEAARRIDRGVEHVGPRRDHLRQPRGAAKHVAEQFAQAMRSSAGSTEARRSRACAPAPRRRRKAQRQRRPIRRRLRGAPASTPSAPRARGRCGPPSVGQNASRERSPPRLPGAESRAPAGWRASPDRRRRP